MSGRNLESMSLIELATLWAQVCPPGGPDPNALIAEFKLRESRLAGIAFGNGHSFAEGFKAGKSGSQPWNNPYERRDLPLTQQRQDYHDWADGCRYGLDSRRTDDCPCFPEFTKILGSEFGIDTTDIVAPEEVVGRHLANILWNEIGCPPPTEPSPSWATITNVVRRVLNLHTQLMLKGGTK